MIERFNRVLGESLQLAVYNNVLWKSQIRDMLWNHRTTPHSVTGEASFVLLKGRKPCTMAVPAWMGSHKEMVVNHEQIRKRIKTYQQQYVSRHNSKITRKQKIHEKGEWVRVMVGGATKKGESKLSEPKRVLDVKGNCVKLSDGNWWNARRIVGCSEVEVKVWLQRKKSANEFIPFKEVKGYGIQTDVDDRVVEDGVQAGKERKVYRRSSVRVKEPSRLLKDFGCG
ncbi:hypothetical protein NDU88_001714 [Pleurodeles waltl]|uniref:Uncharacterized protein n=1 Tax=Pleurodeles waltl TaxID=8319 RepID=A0AAV7WJ57_PLEWA|nr:hypothetical protein NDU88_001714 [Pleurodeles waltl]